MRRIFLVVFFLIVASIQYCSAENIAAELSKNFAMQNARKSFVMNSADGTSYDVYIIGYNEKIEASFSDSAKYRAYISPVSSRAVYLQSANIFSIETSNEDGFYAVKGKNGMPDLLVTTSYFRGSFNTRVFYR